MGVSHQPPPPTLAHSYTTTVGDHRSNGAVERFIYTVKAKLLAMSFNEPKPSLNTSIDKIIWNIRLTKQSSIGCSPFARHFNRSPNTFWKSPVSHAISLDKGKSILSKDRAQDWGADDAFEDGYMENRASENRGFESDPSDKTDRNLLRAPLSNPFSQGRQLTGGKANHNLNLLEEQAYLF